MVTKWHDVLLEEQRQAQLRGIDAAQFPGDTPPAATLLEAALAAQVGEALDHDDDGQLVSHPFRLAEAES